MHLSVGWLQIASNSVWTQFLNQTRAAKGHTRQVFQLYAPDFLKLIWFVPRYVCVCVCPEGINN